MPDAKGSGSQRLEKVRRNMLRMTSPDGFGDDSAKEFGSLSAINVPPWLARADASFGRAVRLIQDSTPPGHSAPVPEVRLEYWRTVRSLLQESEENLASIHHVFEKAEENPLDVSVYLAFVRFLLRLVMQITMAARSGVELAADARWFPSRQSFEFRPPTGALNFMRMNSMTVWAHLRRMKQLSGFPGRSPWTPCSLRMMPAAQLRPCRRN